MQAAFRVARSLFSRGGRPLTPAEAETVDVAALLQAVHVITPAEVGLDPATVARVPAHTIVYQPCFEDATLSVGIFLFGPRTVMPLHNHPGMTVLSHLLLGTLSCTAFDIVEGPQGRKSLSERPTVEITAPETRVLTPTKGNIHSFTAGPSGAAMLDFLAPPYKYGVRDCTYFTRVGTGANTRLFSGPEPESLRMLLQAYRGPPLLG